MLDDQTPEQQQQQDEKNPNPTRVHDPMLEKLNSKFELVSGAPRSWDEISKALQDLKPALANNNTNNRVVTAKSPEKPEDDDDSDHSPEHDSNSPPMKRVHRKSFSFHTLDELDRKVSFNPKPPTQLTKTESLRKTAEFNINKTESPSKKKDEFAIGVAKRLRENAFIMKDRLEREKEGKEAKFEELMKLKRDPLSQYPEICPPGGADSVVLYTTSLGGVRRTYEDCNRARLVLEGHRVVFDERDVSLHGGFRNELKELLGEAEEKTSVPRLFIKGRYIGGVEEVVELNELGRLGRMLNYARVERGVGRQACEGCGGVRFVPCLDCAGSCKVVVGGKRERCPKCNENGLVHCPSCV